MSTSTGAVSPDDPWPVVGGPFYHAEQALRLVRGKPSDTSRIISFLLAVTWLPVVLLAMGERLWTGAPHALLGDLTFHTRLLVAMPLLVIADHAISLRWRGCVG